MRPVAFLRNLQPLARSTERRHDTLCQSSSAARGFLTRSAGVCRIIVSFQDAWRYNCYDLGTTKQVLVDRRSRTRAGPCASNFRPRLHHLLTLNGEIVENSRRRAPPVVFHNSPFFDQFIAGARSLRSHVATIPYSALASPIPALPWRLRSFPQNVWNSFHAVRRGTNFFRFVYTTHKYHWVNVLSFPTNSQ